MQNPVTVSAFNIHALTSPISIYWTPAKSDIVRQAVGTIVSKPGIYTALGGKHLSNCGKGWFDLVRKVSGIIFKKVTFELQSNLDETSTN
jgi:hypothetical protein